MLDVVGPGCVVYGAKNEERGLFRMATLRRSDCCRILLSFGVLHRLRRGCSRISNLFIVRQLLVFGRSAAVVEGQSCCYHGYQRAASLISPHDSYLATNSSPYP